MIPDAVTPYLDSHPHEARELLARLCRQPSVAAQGLGTTEMAGLLEAELRALGFTTQVLAVEDAPPIVYGVLPGASPYTLLLYDHYDVQPPDPLEAWDSPPFEPTVRDGKLYARGTSDDKGEIAARLAAIRALLAVHGQLPITIKYLIEGEEEVGSPHFSTILAPHTALLQADGCLWEGYGFTATGRPRMGLGCKGLLYVQLDLQSTAQDAHSGLAPLLPSAAWRLVHALATLRDAAGQIAIDGFFEHVRRPDPDQRAALADHDDDLAGQLKETYAIELPPDGRRNTALRELQAFTPTCNLAGLVSGYTGAGGKAVLPARAMAKIDFRLVPDQDPRDILAKLQRHLEGHGYGDVQITALGSAEPVVTPVEDPFVRRVATVAAAFAQQAPAITPIDGGTLPMLGWLRRAVAVPGVSAPGNPEYWGSGAHAPNEHIRLSDLDRAVRFNCHLFEALAG